MFLLFVHSSDSCWLSVTTESLATKQVAMLELVTRDSGQARSSAIAGSRAGVNVNGSRAHAAPWPRGLAARRRASTADFSLATSENGDTIWIYLEQRVPRSRRIDRARSRFRSRRRKVFVVWLLPRRPGRLHELLWRVDSFIVQDIADYESRCVCLSQTD